MLRQVGVVGNSLIYLLVGTSVEVTTKIRMLLKVLGTSKGFRREISRVDLEILRRVGVVPLVVRS